MKNDEKFSFINRKMNISWKWLGQFFQSTVVSLCHEEKKLCTVVALYTIDADL